MAKKISLSVLALVFALALAFGFAVIPAGKVSAAGAVIAETKAAEGAYNISTEDNDTKFVVSAKWGTTVNTNGGAQMQLIATEAEISTVNFTIENVGGSDLEIAVVALNTSDGLGNGKSKFSVLSATDCTSSDIDSGYGAKLPAITTGAKKDVSITFDGNIVKSSNDGSFVYLDFSHYNGLPNNSAFTVSNITFGASGSEPEPDPEPAISEGDFYMEGAAIRFDLDTGLRFTALLKESAYVENAEYGIVIFPIDKMSGIDLTAFDKTADYIALIEDKASDYIAERKAKNPDFAYTMETEPVLRQGEGLYELKGTIAEIVYNNLGRKFFAVAYAKIGEKTYYSEFSSNYGTSVAQVAADIYGDEDNEEDEIAILNDIIVRNACRKAGITLEAYNAGGDGQFAITISDKEINVGQTATLSPAATLNGKAINATFTFESEDTSVATIEGSAVTGVKDGSTTVNVYADYYGIKFNTAITVNVSTAVIPTYQVSVTNGTGSGSYQAGELVTIVANNIENKRFTGWTATGVTLSNASASTTTFEMPAGAVTVTANYVDLYAVSVTGGTTDKATAAAGETVTITANDPATGYAFNGWTVTAGNVTLDDDDETKTTFTMGTANVSIKAEYKDIATSGSATIHSVGKYGRVGTPTAINADTSTSAVLNYTWNWGGGGQLAHYAYAEVNGSSGKNIIQFTLVTSGNAALFIGIPDPSKENYNPEYAGNNNKLVAISSMTVNLSSATQNNDDGAKYLYGFNATASTEYNIVIYLSDSLSSDTVIIGVWANEENSGISNNQQGYVGSVTISNFLFTAPVSYDITLDTIPATLATLSSSSATAGTKITLSAIGSGKAVTGFSYESSAGNDTVTGNSFTMPAADVTITEVTLTEKTGGANITLVKKFGSSDNSNTVVSGSGTDTLTVSNAQGNDEYHGVSVKIDGMSGKKSVTFTINNTGSSSYNFKIWMATGNDVYSGDRKVSSATNASTTGASKEGVQGSVASGSSLTITLNFDSNIADNDNLRIAFDGNGPASYTIIDAAAN